MKKLVSLLLACMLMVTLVACGNKNESNVTVSKEEAGTQIEGTLLETEEATLKYVGIEKAEKKLCDDYKTVYLLKFEYSNKTSEPKQCQSVFQIKAFQDGVQVSNSSSAYSSEGGEQYELLGNYFKETMDGGTVTFAKKYSIEKIADVKVIMEDNNNNKATFVIKAEEFQTKEISVSADVIKEKLQNEKPKKDPARVICISEGIHSEYTKFDYEYDMDSDKNPEKIQMNISEEFISVGIGDYHQKFDIENGEITGVYVCDIDKTDNKKNLAFLTSETHGFARIRILKYEQDLPAYKFYEAENVQEWQSLWYPEFAINEDDSITISTQTSITLAALGVSKTYDLDESGVFFERKAEIYEIQHDFSVERYETWYNSVKDFMFDNNDLSEKDREMLRKGYMKAYRTLSTDNFEIKEGEYFKAPYDDGKSKILIEKETGESAWVEFDLEAFGKLNQYFFQTWGF